MNISFKAVNFEATPAMQKNYIFRLQTALLWFHYKTACMTTGIAKSTYKVVGTWKVFSIELNPYLLRPLGQPIKACSPVKCTLNKVLIFPFRL